MLIFDHMTFCGQCRWKRRKSIIFHCENTDEPQSFNPCWFWDFNSTSSMIDLEIFSTLLNYFLLQRQNISNININDVQLYSTHNFARHHHHKLIHSKELERSTTLSPLDLQHVFLLEICGRWKMKWEKKYNKHIFTDSTKSFFVFFRSTFFQLEAKQCEASWIFISGIEKWKLCDDEHVWNFLQNFAVFVK